MPSTSAARARAAPFAFGRRSFNREYLLEFPRMGRRQTAPGVRKFVARRYGYIIYYSIDIAVDELVVLTIRHPSQRPPASGA